MGRRVQKIVSAWSGSQYAAKLSRAIRTYETSFNNWFDMFGCFLDVRTAHVYGYGKYLVRNS